MNKIMNSEVVLQSSRHIQTAVWPSGEVEIGEKLTSCIYPHPIAKLSHRPRFSSL